jgi:hypothetical protein
MLVFFPTWKSARQLVWLIIIFGDSMLKVAEKQLYFRKNNQLDASISKIYFCHKTLHVSGIFCVHYQGLSTVHTVIGTLHAGYVAAS